jgi:uncharacterized protein (TIGR03790 family)
LPRHAGPCWYHHGVRPLLCALAACLVLRAQTGENVLLVVNGNDPVSRRIADYYRPRRSIPAANVCTIQSETGEEVSWEIYERQIEAPVAGCLKRGGLSEKVLYIVTAMGVPLKIAGAGSGFAAEYGSVDSELALLYSKIKGTNYPRTGAVKNPFYMRTDAPFAHPRFPIYLVARLAAYDFEDVKAVIDRAQPARNRGVFVLDVAPGGDDAGNAWLRSAAAQLPKDRVVLDETPGAVYDQKNVIGYAGWGSNDRGRRRHLGFEWLPGAVAAEYVSSNGRTLRKPPDNWTYTNWGDVFHYFAGSPQGLSADLLHDGATAAPGNVYEPFLAGCARPDYLLPAWFRGRNLADSYYASIQWLSWQGVLFGDPLCALK